MGRQEHRVKGEATEVFLTGKVLLCMYLSLHISWDIVNGWACVHLHLTIIQISESNPQG